MIRTPLYNQSNASSTQNGGWILSQYVRTERDIATTRPLLSWGVSGGSQNSGHHNVLTWQAKSKSVCYFLSNISWPTVVVSALERCPLHCILSTSLSRSGFSPHMTQGLLVSATSASARHNLSLFPFGSYPMALTPGSVLKGHR